MFLKQLIRRNPEFIQAAVRLHQNGQIPANSYVLDLDTIEKNGRAIAAEGQSLGLKVFPMTKQFGRNAAVMDVLARAGLDSYVAVDMSCANAIHAAGYTNGHIGHLVQIPFAETRTAASFSPSYWTVFNEEKAREASNASALLDRRQDLLARIQAPGDIFYMGHEGGFDAGDILQVADRFDSLPNARFAGITTFPALLYDVQEQAVRPTPNMKTLDKTAQVLRSQGRTGIEINAPGTTSIAVMEMLASAGATQVEPGHGLTGTTPLHAVRDLTELPAAMYLSEISHVYHGQPYCFGGGLYIDPVFPDYDVRVLAGKDPDQIFKQSISVKIPPANAIDYYGILQPSESDRVAVGDTVIFGFRIQAFVTRAYVVPVSGISRGEPVVEGVFTSEGRKTNWPEW
jgi:predicted amino acid racemase